MTQFSISLKRWAQKVAIGNGNDDDPEPWNQDKVSDYRVLQFHPFPAIRSRG